MARIVITVDGQKYSSKKKALAEFLEAMRWCEGSEGERMAFAYYSIMEGYTNINTYRETAE